jgi:hypothetical protein
LLFSLRSSRLSSGLEQSKWHLPIAPGPSVAMPSLGNATLLGGLVMCLTNRSFSVLLRLLGLVMLAGIVLVSCGPTANQSTAPTSPYDRAKDAFKGGNVEKALQSTDKLATTTPPASSLSGRG